jgi:hypothetical protein
LGRRREAGAIQPVEDRSGKAVAAAAIANLRGASRGAPAISNVLELIKHLRGGLYEQLIETARVALEAAELVRKEGTKAVTESNRGA